MRDCEFSEYMIERLYAEDARRIDEEQDEEQEDEDEDYDWRDEPTPTLDEEVDRELFRQ